MILKGGFTNYEQLVGVLMLDTRFPRPKGDIGNALSYDFPVRYKTVRGADTSKIMGDEPSPDLLRPFIEAAKELEADGVSCITTSCGFLAPFQPQIAAAVDIPVFTSSLIQAPLISAILPPGKTIGVFTERAKHLTDRHFRGVGWDTDRIKTHIQGMPADAQFPATYIGGRNELDTEVLRQEMIDMTYAFLRDCQNPGAILFECTNMCPFSADVAGVSGLPVFDINTMINFVKSGFRPRKFLSE
ncbi:aspartate/glutamate racemase family protein [Cupriavidus pinatubonensis]|uniref:Aspartate/glutamate racemase family protein n=1 Tax=Cupriavidus pinatubonensis TaxID=248026 RepID=A0ABN7ZLF3_9BURK|nr:aspartate/glutamate racemase family protein [Cupriavidus pinatubonensis]CAG9185017.1 hypothetical protein LMG23994_05580 [Cupriavidus pinatubonensis]